MRVWCTAALALFLQQPTAVSRAQGTLQNGSLEGVIVRAGTTEPVAGAHITLERIDTEGARGGVARSLPPILVDVDSSGRFSLKDLAPGTFQLNAAADGYVRREALPVKILSGPAKTTITVKLVQTGNISGRIRDEDNRFAVNAQVQLLRPIYDAWGNRMFEAVASTTTNDRGEYRLFWVSPGKYYLAASAPDLPNLIRINRDNRNTGAGVPYALGYYPGVANQDAAIVFEVRSGEDASADLSIPLQRFYTVRGKIVDVRGQASAKTINIVLHSQGIQQSSAIIRATFDPTNGSFEARSVPTGSYIIEASTSQPNQSPTAENMKASAEITVKDADISGLELRISPPISILGRLTVEGAKLPPLVNGAQIRIRLVTENRFLVPVSPQTRSIESDGTFRIDGIPLGNYRVTVCLVYSGDNCMGDMAGFYLKGVQFGSLDILNEPLHVTDGVGSDTLNVLVSLKPGRIEGIVKNDKEPARRGTQLILIPNEHRDRLNLYNWTISEEAGHFSFEGITPGSYKIFALEQLEDNAFFHPDFLKEFDSRGTTVRIGESQELTVEIKVIPKDK